MIITMKSVCNVNHPCVVEVHPLELPSPDPGETNGRNGPSQTFVVNTCMQLHLFISLYVAIRLLYSNTVRYHHLGCK